jgi:hypothetical protein
MVFKWQFALIAALIARRSSNINVPLGSVLSLKKLGQTFFAVIMTKTPLLMGFLVYELNYQ